MFTKLLLSVALSTSLLASVEVLAQETTTDTKAAEAKDTSVLDYVKSKFSFSYHGEYLFQRSGENKLDTFRWMHNPSIIYRPIENWRLLVTSEFKYFNNDNPGTYINQHYRSLVTLMRENVLTEKENGIKLDIGAGRRIFDQAMPKASSYGNTRLITSMRKSLTKDFTTSLYAQYLLNDPTQLGRGRPNMWKHSLELIPSFSWQITDKFSWFFNDDITIYTPENSGQKDKLDFGHEMNIGFWNYQFNDKHGAYFQFKYLHFTGSSFQRSFQNQMDWFDYYIGHTYSFTSKMSFTTEVGSTMFRGGDGKKFFAEDMRYPGVYFYFDFSL